MPAKWFAATGCILAVRLSVRTSVTLVGTRKSGIDPVSGCAYHVVMAEPQQSESKARIENLASQVDELIQVCERLKAENDSLRAQHQVCLLYTSPSPRDGLLSRMPSSA